MKKKKPRPKVIVEDDNGQLTVTGSNVLDLDNLVKLAKIDLNLWECTNFKITKNEWDVTMSGYKSSTDEDVTYTNEQFKIEARFQRKVEIYNPEQFEKELTENIIEKINLINRPVKEFKLSNNNECEIDIFDFHFGKLGWIKETGSTNWDYKLASKLFRKTIKTLSKRALDAVNGEISRWIFPIGNDFFNADNSYPYPTTTKGTYQQEDLRWQKIFHEAWMLVVEAIEVLLETAPVKIIVVPGNHDFQRSYYLGSVLAAYYNNYPLVEVNNEAIPFKFYEFGYNLIGYAHGNSKDISIDRLKQLMQITQPKAWARTRFREWHLGDIHHKKIIKTPNERIILGKRSSEKGQVVEEDLQGIVIRYMRSISGDDGWHTSKGYLGSIKGAEAYIYNRKEGPIHIINFNPNQKNYR